MLINIILAIVGIIAVIIAVVLVVAALQPAAFRITRETVISAPPAVVFAQVNDLRKWEAWSPWAKLDPEAKMTYEGPSTGPGASYTWAGNNKVGEGRTTITESRPSDMIRLKLEFIRPFTATNDVKFTFKPESNHTVVEWSMSGQNKFMGKVFNLIMNCDKMVGGQFETGLANLKSVSEITTN